MVFKSVLSTEATLYNFMLCYVKINLIQYLLQKCFLTCQLGIHGGPWTNSRMFTKDKLGKQICCQQAWTQKGLYQHFNMFRRKNKKKKLANSSSIKLFLGITKIKYLSDYFLWLTTEMRALASLLSNSLIFRPIKTAGKDVSVISPLIWP